MGRAKNIHKMYRFEDDILPDEKVSAPQLFMGKGRVWGSHAGHKQDLRHIARRFDQTLEPHAALLQWRFVNPGIKPNRALPQQLKGGREIVTAV